MSYLGRSAKLSLKAQEKVSFLATAGQTSKTGLSYTVGFIEVYVNGVLLTDTTDFTATNGSSVTFTVALLLNDEVTVISLKTFTVADHYSKTEADTLLAAKSPLASPVFTGNVGVGVTPESWHSDYVAVQVGDGGGLSGKSTGDATFLTSNAYRDSVNNRWEYIGANGNATATAYQQSSGNHYFQVAPSGTADSAISWTTGFEVLADGKARSKNGLLFGTDTAAANTLDDYEEGTYTPAILSAGSACNATVSHVGGAYTKIGRLVTASIRLRTTDNGTATGQLGISLPFAVGDNISTTGLEGAACLAMVTGVTAAHTDLYVAPNEGTSAIRFDFKTSSTSNLTNQLGVHQTANIFDCRVTITYMT